MTEDDGELRVEENEDGSFTIHNIDEFTQELLIGRGVSYIMLQFLFNVSESEIFQIVKKYSEERNGVES